MGVQEFQGVFDNGFSGIIGSDKNKLPDYIDKLATDNADFDPEKIETVDIEYDPRNLDRATDLSDDNVRTVANKEIKDDQENKKIEKACLVLLHNGSSIDGLIEQLKRKFAVSLLRQYLNSFAYKTLMDKFGQIGYVYVDKRGFKDCNEIKSYLRNRTKAAQSFISKVRDDGECNDCSMLKRGYCILTNLKVEQDPKISSSSQAKAVINKIASSSAINETIVKEYVVRLASEDVNRVVADFVSDFDDNIRASSKVDEDNVVSFKRDSDKKQAKERIVRNNIEKNRRVSIERKNGEIFPVFKTHIFNGLDQKQATKRLLDEGFKPTEVENFNIYSASKIKDFMNKQSHSNFDTDFAKLKNEEVVKDVNNLENKANYNESRMTNYAFNLMTNGKTLDEIKQRLKKAFSLDEVRRFVKENKSKLEKNYGQLGYVFIDSNIYANCRTDEMRKAFSNISHVGKRLIHAVKSNKNCKGCIHNKSGSCEKVGLMLSNNPIANSPRAAKKIFKKAMTFLPNKYIEKYESELVYERSNRNIVASFALNIKNMLAEENKNIGKTASKDRKINKETYDVLNKVNLDGDMNYKESKSSIIENIINDTRK